MTDNEIIRSGLQGNSDNYRYLVEKYQQMVFRTCIGFVHNKDDADDLTQDVFIQAYQALSRFKGDSAFSTWLYRIATNECIRLLRTRKKMNQNIEELTDKLILRLGGTDMESGDEILVKFQNAILRLPEKQRLVFTLRYYDDLPYEEISFILKTSVNALKTNYHYAQEKIKQHMLNN